MEEVKPEPQLDTTRFQLAETVRNAWAITVPGGEHKPTREQILSPAFLAHVASKLNPYDRIEVRCDDGSFFGEVIVRKTDRMAATCEVLAWKDFDAAADDVRGLSNVGFAVAWKGPHLKYAVIRDTDKAIVYQGASSRADAQLWLDNYMKVAA